MKFCENVWRLAIPWPWLATIGVGNQVQSVVMGANGVEATVERNTRTLELKTPRSQDSEGWKVRKVFSVHLKIHQDLTQGSSRECDERICQL